MANNNPNPTRGIGGKFTGSKPSVGNEARGNNGRDFVDPATAGQAAGEPQEPGERIKRRDPPSGGTIGGGTTASGAKAGAKKSASLDLSAAAGLISGFHAIIAMQRSEPHWLLNDADALRYGTALANALRHMPIRAAQKTIDYATLVMVAFVMETPRIVRSVQLARTPKPPNRGPAQVFQFHPPQQAQPTPAAPTTSPPDNGQAPPIAEGPPDLSAFGGEAPS
jgi:hypothetical protein